MTVDEALLNVLHHFYTRTQRRAFASAKAAPVVATVSRASDSALVASSAVPLAPVAPLYSAAATIKSDAASTSTADSTPVPTPFDDDPVAFRDRLWFVLQSNRSAVPARVAALLMRPRATCTIVQVRL